MINDYHFEKYYPPFIRHIKRHFEGSGIPGSIFTNSNLDTPKKVIDYSYSTIAGIYEGKRLLTEIDYPEITGLEAIIPISKIPRRTRITRGQRIKASKDSQRKPSYTVTLAHGIPLHITNKITIIAEPVKGKSDIHAFSSIFPGRYAPDFDDQVFWRNHAFIVS